MRYYVEYEDHGINKDSRFFDTIEEAYEWAKRKKVKKGTFRVIEN